MSISYFGTGTRATGTGVTHLDVPLPASVPSGAVMICFAGGNVPSSSSMTIDTGWSTLDDSLGSNGQFSTFYKVATSSESNPRVTFPTTSNGCSAVIIVFTNVDTTNPFIAHGASHGTGTNQASYTSPSVTNTDATSTGVFCTLHDSVDSGTWSTPSDSGSHSYTVTLNWDDSASASATGVLAYHSSAAAAATTVMSQRSPHSSAWGGTALLFLTPGSTPTTGTLGATAPHFTASVNGTSQDDGSVAVTAPHFTAGLHGTSADAGSISATAPHFTAGLHGSTAYKGQVAATAPHFTAGLHGSSKDLAVLGATVPAFTASLDATAADEGALGATVPGFTASFEADNEEPTAGVLAATLGGFTADFEAQVPIEVEVDLQTPRFRASFAAEVPTVGQITATAPSFNVLILGIGGEDVAESGGQGAYWDLIAILSNSQRIAEQDENRLDATPTDCPKCGTVLKASRDGIRFCPWDGWKQTEGYKIENPG